MWFWLALSLAFFITFFLTPFVAKFSFRWGFVDDPTRNHPAVIHKKPVPRAGGIAIFTGFTLSLITTVSISQSIVLTKSLIGILISGFIIVIVGILDDKYDLSPYLRLIFNFLVAAIVVGSGVGITSFTNPFGGLVFLDKIVYSFSLPDYFGPFSGPHSIILLADIVAFFWIIWMMNALNWSSGVDGQLTGIATITLIIIAIVSSQLTPIDPNQFIVTLLAVAAGGAFLGFLPWSFYPQKIMPGYGGASLAGFLIAVLAILSGAKLATALLVLLVPLVDSIWAVIRRVLSGKSPVWGDSFHLHHQLLKFGWSVPQICFLYYFMTLILGVLAINLDTQRKFFAIVILGIIIFAFLFTSFVLLRKVKLKSRVKPS